MPLNVYSLSRLRTLQPAIRPLALRLAELAEERGIKIRIVSAHRPLEAQQVLWEQGRTRPGPVVTAAEPGLSYHNYGLAFDVVPEEYINLKDWNPSGPYWMIIGQIGESLGLEWGGRWAEPDRPHFQIPSSLAPIRELKAYWDKFKTVMPISLSPSAGGIAMILLVLLGVWLYSRWAGRII